MSIESLIDDFSLLDDWEDRYRYVIELGKALPPLPEEDRTERNKVRGCASQVWLVPDSEADGTLRFRGDSDAHIVRGLVAILLDLYSNRSPREILDLDAEKIFGELGLREHLTSQRANGLSSMVERIRHDARRAFEKERAQA
ncbi:Cysteine desulfuration protein SufE [Faunimonas pinastri]|uniref:Cysteine desulfuration protein SufE n=1 Tax=Faunimonas pinastri TaxID=1855383 RepID=A0A1H9M9S7_9HYPH|nr:SufE family protein [Faunimonas pinastri]SER20466.1 Cysteine desulfuration protein SufE [Faunimonas pinastri]